MVTRSSPYQTPDASSSSGDESAHAAAHSPRIAIEAVQPSLEQGRFAAKAIAGRPVTVSAVIFADGHDVLAAAVNWCDDQGQHRRE
ncbi:MAG: maltotransferase domain-containing protein, partial [Pseudomonadota bacterium]|nr:maltotransferase domain-containing protein [Pseudomonadota bacterium]